MSSLLMEASFKFSALETAEYDTGQQSFVVIHKLQKKKVAIFSKDIDL
jgi:hypothetical protein